MMQSVFRAPMNLFFDVTPTGRVLNKFSKDLDQVDNMAFWSFGACQSNITRVASTILLCAWVAPLTMVALPIVLFSSFYLYSWFAPAFKDQTRLQSITKSPILSQFQASINGQQTIRAFNKQEQFQDATYVLLNNNVIAV